MEEFIANQDWANLSHPSRCDRSDLLRVRNLSVNIREKSGRELHVLRQVSFAIAPGEIVGLLGESGCGKTTLALALMGLLPAAARAVEGSIDFRQNNLLAVDPTRLRKIRGAEISVIYQDSDVLNPVMRAGDQIMEVLRAHTDLSSRQMREQVLALLSALRFEDCERIFQSYPHQLSGGQRCRIAIAQAVACRPRLVIADEPTAWLDSGTTAEILSLFSRLRDLYQTAFLLISHDPETLMLADRALVMYAGQIVESGSMTDLFERPQHPYTHALMQCRSQSALLPQREAHPRRFACIAGQAPDPSETFSGCSFAARCVDRMEVCDSHHPKLIEIAAERSVRCFKFEEPA